MKKFVITVASALMLIVTTYTIQPAALHAQEIHELTKSYKSELDKLKNKEEGEEFFWTHVKDAYGLTDNLLKFTDALVGGEYTKQIDYVMSVPEQRWNPAGWGYYEQTNVVKIIKKNVTKSTTTKNLSDYSSKISTGLKLYSLTSDIAKAIEGDDAAKLNSVKTTYDLVSGWLTTDFPGMGPAMTSVGFMSFALDKFIKTTLNEYNEYWWIQYRNYLENKYPGFVQSWAPLATQEGGKETIDKRLYEFWSDAEFDKGPTFYRASLYAKENFAKSFAAKYFRDYLQQSFKTLVKLNAEREEAKAYIQFLEGSRELQQIIDELKTLQTIIELAEKEMKEKEKTPVSLIISPAQTTLSIGETTTFTAFAIFEDEAITNISGNESIRWTPGNSFTAVEDGVFTLSVSYMGLSAQATISVEDEVSPQCNEPSEIFDEETGKCVCNAAEGYEMNDELGKCINIDRALDEVTEGVEDAKCEKESLIASLSRLDELVASGNRIAADFKGKLNKFIKEINDQNSNPCENSIIAVSYAGARETLTEYELLVEEVRSLSTDLILLSRLCPLEEINLDIAAILQKVSQLGARGQIQEGVTMMENQLHTFGCDKQKVEDQGDTIAEQGDPEILQAGGAGASEICGDGIDNDGDGLIDEGCEGVGNFNVIIILYDSGSAADDIFGLSVSGQGNLGTTPEGGSRTYPLRLSPGSYMATVTVIGAPDNVGTYTIRILEGDNEIAASTGGPPQGSVITVPFSIGGNPGAEAEIESILPSMRNFVRQIEQSEEKNN